MLWILNGWRTWALYAAWAYLLAYLARWYIKEAIRLRRRLRLAAEQRRRRRALQTDRPFHAALIKTDERQALTNPAGQTTDQWMRAAARDYLDGRREDMPTRAEYYTQFGAAMRKHHRSLRAPQDSTKRRTRTKATP